MNESLFRVFFGLTGRAPWLDAALVFAAEWLGWVMAASFAVWVLWRISDAEVRLVAVSAATNSLVAWIVARLIKMAYVSPRPFVNLLDIEPLVRFGGADSFPSGHAIVAFAFALTVHKFNRGLGSWYLVAATLISLARVVIGIHWPMDVLGGFILAAVIVTIFHFAYQHVSLTASAHLRQ